MRNRVLSLSLVICFTLALMVVGTATKPVQAQSGASVTCDSTLITLLYVAEANYGFHSAMDLAKFEKGQFKSMFDSMMMAPNAMMATESAMMAATPDAMMAATSAMMGTPDAMMAALKPGVVQGEDAACTSLRAEVEGYLMTKFSSMMMH